MTAREAPPEVRLEPWGEGDLWLLEQSNTEEMTAFLGGPETPQKVASRHRKYVENAFTGQMLVIVLPDGERVGSIGYWEHEEPDGTTVWETGWGVLPQFHGRGIAAAAVAALVELVTAKRSHRTLHAYPSVDNAASNALCRKAGFTLRGEVEFEYPKGQWMRCNDWALDLSG
jgi:RimJ/RimL family protein N-acetyltransferase